MIGRKMLALAALSAASAAQAQVSIRAPFVRVDVGGPGVGVRAPFVNIFVPSGPPPIYLPPGYINPPPGFPIAPGAVVPGEPPRIQPPIQPPPLTPKPSPLPQQQVERRPNNDNPDFVPPAPKEVETPTLESFMKTFQPKAGSYEVTLKNPVTNQPTNVRFTLPGVPQRVATKGDEIEFVYGPLSYVKLKFDRDGVMVITR